MLIVTKNDILEEWPHFILGQVVWKLAHLIQEVNILIQNQRQIWLQNGIYQEVHMRLLEDMRDLLKQLVKGDSTLVVSFLGYFVQPLQVGDFKNGLVDQVPEEILWLLDQLNMAVDEVYLFE